MVNISGNAGVLGAVGDTNQYMAEINRRQAETDNFQAILERQLEKPGAGITEREDKEIRSACESFESYFLQMIFREMRKTSFDEGGFIPKSNAEKIFTDMMDEEVSKSTAKSGGIGLAKMLYKQMTAQLKGEVVSPS